MGDKSSTRIMSLFKLYLDEYTLSVINAKHYHIYTLSNIRNHYVYIKINIFVQYVIS
jgi:hypothetical protein